MFGIAREDLDEIVRGAAPDLDTLRGARIFLTGGTGFFGKWLLAAFDAADRDHALGLRLTILSRDPRTFFEKYPEASQRPAWEFIAGDVATFDPPPGPFDYVIHAAADTTAVTTPQQEAERTRAIVAGTDRVLALARATGTRRLLYLSSGAVYGVAAVRRGGAAEDDFSNAQAVTPYGRAKRAAEAACTRSGLDVVIARPFAFLGPHLPLDAHYAAGNFLRDARRGGPIEVRGDGTALRSYLYPTDLIVWLLALLARGKPGTAYNVGSDEIVSTAELARRIAGEEPSAPQVVIQSREPQGPQNIYLPDLARAQNELGLDVRVSLTEAIRRFRAS